MRRRIIAVIALSLPCYLAVPVLLPTQQHKQETLLLKKWRKKILHRIRLRLRPCNAVMAGITAEAEVTVFTM